MKRLRSDLISRREKKIVGLLELGLSHKAIADVLVTTEREVRRVKAAMQNQHNRSAA